MARPYVGNLRTGAFEPSGDRPSLVHLECVGKVGRNDLKWVADDSDA